MNERSLDIGPSDMPLGFTDSIDIHDDERLRRISEEDQGQSYGNFVRGDIEDLPYDDSSFNKINAGQVIGSYSDVELSLSEVHRVLKPGGVFTMRTWGEYVPEVLRVSKSLGFMVVKNERGFYEDDYKEDYVDMRMLKSMRSL